MSRNPIYMRLIQSRRWRELRLWKLRRQPLCEECLRQGRVTPATEVHHITPVESGVTARQMTALMFAPGNLMSLCAACHHELHRLMKSHSREAARQANRRKTADFIKRFFSMGD